MRSLPYYSVGAAASGTSARGCARAIDIVLHRGRSAHPDRPDNFSVDLNGKPSAIRRHAPERGNAGQKRRVALDILRGDAEQSCVRLILRDLDGRIGAPSIRLKALRLPPSSRIATFSVTPIFLAFALAIGLTPQCIARWSGAFHTVTTIFPNWPLFSR